MVCASCGELTAAPAGSGCEACGADPALDGRYCLERVLGHGSQATTWRALRIQDGRAVAIKELPLGATRDPKARALLHREAEVLRQLDHPAIPRWHDHFILRSGRSRTLYLVQDLVEGVTLADLAESHRFTEAEVLDIARELLDVLGYLHGLCPPVVHRDLKPANVMRGTDGRLFLVDFGSVRDAQRTLSGSTITGTFGYMAPEQFAGEASPQTDLYGLGAMLVALLTRTEPRHLLGPDRRLRWRQRVDVSAETEELLDALLHPLPELRPPSAPATLARLQATPALDERITAFAEPLPQPFPEPFFAPPITRDRGPELVIVQRPPKLPWKAFVALAAGAAVALLVAPRGDGPTYAEREDVPAEHAALAEAYRTHPGVQSCLVYHEAATQITDGPTALLRVVREPRRFRSTHIQVEASDRGLAACLTHAAKQIAPDPGAYALAIALGGD